MIDADALKTPIEDRIDNIPASEYDNGWNNAIYAVIDEIDNAPTECEKYRSFCMGKQRPQANNNAELFKQTFGIYATEVWSMREADFVKWLNQETPQ